MAKDKKSSKVAATAPKPALSKPMESVKAGRVSKPIESAKKAAKDGVKKVKEVEKKKKKAKSPTPEPSSDSGDESDTSASSASSAGGSDDAEVKAVPKTNGAPKVANGADDSSSASEDEDDSPPKTATIAKTNGAANGKAVAASDDDDEDDDDDDSSSGSDSDDDAKAGAANGAADAEMDDDDSSSDGSSDEEDMPAAKTNGKFASSKKDASGSDDSEDDSEDDSSSDEEDAAEVKPKVEEPSKKRKAEDSVDKTPKKTKVMVDVGGEQKEACPNLFIGNLSWNVDEEWLTQEFEKFGELAGVRIITDKESGRSKGFGYVEFTETSNAVTALQEKTGADLDGRAIRIDFSLPRPARNDFGGTPQQRGNDRAKQFGDSTSAPSTTLWVGNVPFEADESVLTEAFQDFGSIKSIRMPTDRETGEPKGFGYVEFYSVDEAKAAFDGMTGQQVAGRPVRLDFAAQRSNDSPRGGFGDRGRGGRGGGRGGFGDRGGRGGGRGRGGFNDRGRGGRGGGRGGGSFNRGGFGDFSGKKTTF